MKYYKTIIEGKNCWVNIDGTTRKLGFFTTRLAPALDAEQAKTTALQELSKELRSRLMNDLFDPPEMAVNEVVEISPTEIDTISSAGFTWYPQDTTPAN